MQYIVIYWTTGVIIDNSTPLGKGMKLFPSKEEAEEFASGYRSSHWMESPVTELWKQGAENNFVPCYTIDGDLESYGGFANHGKGLFFA